MAFQFEAYKNDVTRKAEAARRDMATRLFREDGVTRRYGPTDHQEALNHILQPLQQAVAEAQEHAQAAQAEAKRLEAQQHADPLSALTTDELIRLQAAKDLAKDEITQLTPAELGPRLTAVAASGDKVSQVLHVLYAKPMVQQSNDSALHNQLAAIDESVYGKQRAEAAKALEQAQRLSKEAAELSFFASSTLGEVDGSNAARFEQRRREYAAAF